MSYLSRKIRWYSRTKRIRWLAATAVILVPASGITTLIVDRLLNTAEINTARYFEVSSSPLILDRNGRLLHVSLNEQDEWCLPFDFQRQSRFIREATVAVEDQRFYVHPGVDTKAIVRAGIQTVLKGKVTSGASTITMQLVKITDT